MFLMFFLFTFFFYGLCFFCFSPCFYGFFMFFWHGLIIFFFGRCFFEGFWMMDSWRTLKPCEYVGMFFSLWFSWDFGGFLKDGLLAEFGGLLEDLGCVWVYGCLT